MKNFENEFTTKNMTQPCHNAFTLAETLITVAILGVVAAITIPAIINHQTESANRTKLKKAMTTYEKALNQMIIENDLKTNDAIAAFGSDGGNCANTTEYFKKVEGEGCRFKTADRIWWDITDIENPLVMLKDKYSEETIANLKALAKKEDDREVFGMVGRLDDSIGVLRINDKGAETIGDNKTYLDKLYGFLNPSSTTAEVYCGGACKASKITEACTNELKNCYYFCGTWGIDYYDENGDAIMYKSGCTDLKVENCQSSTVFDKISLENGGNRTIVYSNCSAEGETCEKPSSIRYSSDTVLKGGYSVSGTYIEFYSCEGDIETCTGFCGSILDPEGNDVTSSMTVSEIATKFYTK